MQVIDLDRSQGAIEQTEFVDRAAGRAGLPEAGAKRETGVFTEYTRAGGRQDLRGQVVAHDVHRDECTVDVQVQAGGPARAVVGNGDVRPLLQGQRLLGEHGQHV